MPRQANGNYIQPANTAAVTSTPISSTAFNTLETDIGNEITNSLDRGGRSAMTAALPMGANKITGMADPAVATDAATKNYVDTTTAAFFSTGDGKITLKIVADTGWILCDDGTFGSATSGSSSRANADTQSLFTLFFNNLSDTAAPILTSGGGATTRAAQVSASAAWAANCRMSLTKQLGRAIVGAGTGSGLTARPLGAAFGADTFVLGQTNLPSVNFVLAATTSSPDVLGSSSSSPTGPSAAGGAFLADRRAGSVTINTTGTAASGGSNTAFSLAQASTAWNVMVKL